MFIRILIICCLFVRMTGQGPPLKTTVKQFFYLVEGRGKTLKQFTEDLSPIFVSNINKDSLCREYYQHWERNFAESSYPLKTKIHKIKRIGPITAEVFIKTIWHMPDGKKVKFIHATVWKWESSGWKRTDFPARQVLRKEIS